MLAAATLATAHLRLVFTRRILGFHVPLNNQPTNQPTNAFCGRAGGVDEHPELPILDFSTAEDRESFPIIHSKLSSSCFVIAYALRSRSFPLVLDTLRMQADPDGHLVNNFVTLSLKL